MFKDGWDWGVSLMWMVWLVGAGLKPAPTGCCEGGGARWPADWVRGSGKACFVDSGFPRARE